MKLEIMNYLSQWERQKGLLKCHIYFCTLPEDYLKNQLPFKPRLQYE